MTFSFLGKFEVYALVKVIEATFNFCYDSLKACLYTNSMPTKKSLGYPRNLRPQSTHGLLGIRSCGQDYLPNLFLSATQSTTTTTPPTRVTYAPEETLYRITTDYHWPEFYKNRSHVSGEWLSDADIGFGPFGFGESLILPQDSCMSDANYMHSGDDCQRNPKYCKKGLAFSIWEKYDFDDNVVTRDLDNEVVKQQYIVTTGASYDKDTGKAYPGFSIFHEGIYLVAVVSTGEEVWEVKVKGQLYNNTWTNIGVRWEPPKPDTNKPIDEWGGLELYVNLKRVGHTVLATTTTQGSPYFDEVTDYQINGNDPPVIMVGCTFDYQTEEFTKFNKAEFDELAAWSRTLTTNDTHDETVFFFGGFESKFEDVNPAQFKALLNNADLGNWEEASVAEEILSAMLLPKPSSLAPYPTRTTREKAETKSKDQQQGKDGGGTTAAPKVTTESNIDEYQLAKSHLTLQEAISDILDPKYVGSINNPDQVVFRLTLAVVANKIVSGDAETRRKWEAVHKYFINEEGAPKTVRELEGYMLAWVGSTNLSYTGTADFYDNKKKTMKYATSGEDFVMNVEKLPVEVFRRSPRINLPNYDGLEWLANKAKWDDPRDTFSVPTGMYKDQPGCNQNPVTFMTTVYNELANSMPFRRQPAYIRGQAQVDGKIFSCGVAANHKLHIISNIISKDDAAALSKCKPSESYLRDNPIKGTFYHKNYGKARLSRRILSFFSDNEYVAGGNEVRHCVLWNYDFGPTGSWDPAKCELIETDAEKTTCHCKGFGMMTVVLEISEPIEIEDDCPAQIIVKYIGMAISIILLMMFILVTIGSKYVWDMFHVLRMHVSFNWICAIIFHVVADLDDVRDDPEVNVIVGFFMKYFYSSSCIWMTLEAHATFKAFTSGIISGRTKVYLPFGYGLPLLPLGILFIVYHDDIGIDPRCFVGWNREAKALYLLFNLIIAFIGVILAIIIIFNLAKPQTKRRNLVADLTSQAKGTAAISFFTMVLWIFAGITYLHKQDSDMKDPYCYFVIYLGLYGVIMFICLGAMSKKFRYGLKSKKQLKKQLLSNYVSTRETDQLQGKETQVEVVSRPATATSNLPTEDIHSSSNDEGGSDDESQRNP